MFARQRSTPTSDGAGPPNWGGPALLDFGDNSAQNELLAARRNSGDDPPVPSTTSLVDLARLVEVHRVLDTDGDGYVSMPEIDAALLNPELKGEIAAIVVALRGHLLQIEALSDDEWGPENDGITVKDLEALDGNDLKPDVNGTAAYANGKISSASHQLFDGPIDYTALQQGQLADCYFLAAVDSMALQRPEDIQKMIVDHGDGTYTVTFPGRKAVTIPAPTDAEIGAFGGSGANGLWVAVLEKAYATETNNGLKAKSAVPQDSIGEGGLLRSGVAAITGQSKWGTVNTDTLATTSKATTRARLADALGQNKVVTASVGEKIPYVEGEGPDGLVRKHVYSVLHYDKASDTVTVRNPWGHGEIGTRGIGGDLRPRDGTDDGEMKLKLDEFYAYFMQLSYEK